MPLPQPVPGLVVNFRYLWRHEHVAGEEEGRKERPCVVIVAVVNRAGITEVIVAPVTHRRPEAMTDGVEMPAAVKAHLGLDDAPSWIIATDLNVFTWPGYDLRPIAGSKPPRFAYGKIPPRLFAQLLERVRASAISKPTPRDGT